VPEDILRPYRAQPSRHSRLPPAFLAVPPLALGHSWAICRVPANSQRLGAWEDRQFGDPPPPLLATRQRGSSHAWSGSAAVPERLTGLKPAPQRRALKFLADGRPIVGRRPGTGGHFRGYGEGLSYSASSSVVSRCQQSTACRPRPDGREHGSDQPCRSGRDWRRSALLEHVRRGKAADRCPARS
jgi:hypothetical protein